MANTDWWADSSGEDVSKVAEKEFDGGGGTPDLIPDKTNCLMSLVRAAWKGDEGKRFVNVQWSVVKPEVFGGTVVFQKVWCGDLDQSAKDPAKKRDKALRMLATIDANAGGKLAKAGREPDDDDLALALTNKQMVCKVMLWEMEDREKPGEMIRGNWVSMVAGKGGSLEISDVKAKPAAVGGGGSQARRPAPSTGFADDMDDDIPFLTMNSIW